LTRPGDSVAFFQKSIALSSRTGDRRNAMQCFFGLGQAFLDIDDKKAAFASLDSGLVMGEQLSIPDISWRLYRQRAKLLERAGQNEAAFQDYQKAVDIVEKQRSELKVAAYQQGFLDDKMDLYSDAVRLLLDMKQADRAFDFVERAKSRNFIDLLGNQKPPAKKGGENRLATEQTARQAVQEAQDRLAELARRKTEWTQKDQNDKSFWESELEKRRKAYGDLLAAIQSESPELASFVSVDPFQVPKIQSFLPDSTALIEYYVSTDELMFWFMTSTRLSDYRVHVSASQIENAVKKFREGIQSHLSIDQESQMLYAWLIEPCVKELQGIRHIILVPHGILHYLPFSALKDKTGLYLIDDFSISLAPSATVAGYCMDKSNSRAAIRQKGYSVLAVANPNLGDDRYDLPFASREVQSLKRTFGSVNALIGSAATEEAVRQSAENTFRLAHFACHGEYEPETPLFSALLLTSDPSDDGRLEAQEIFGMQFDCDLVTLSACETGLATITRGDEIIGLARSFIFSGAPSVITSLWKVDDLATAVLMKRFYRNLRHGYSKAEALRRAQILVRESLNSHPSAWAAFHITGDFR
jgi:CHAT domain-containing protein